MNLSNICLSLSNLTGAKWSLKGDKGIAREDGLAFWFRENGYGNIGRIAIHFDRPNGRDGHPVSIWGAPGQGRIDNPSITVAGTKADEKIANDISRRLVADSEVVFVLANEAVARENSYIDGKANAITDICNLIGGTAKTDYNSGKANGEIDPYKAAGIESFCGRGYGKITVSNKDSISLELTSMNFETASKVIAAVVEILKGVK
jgi:hypothetical protein